MKKKKLLLEIALRVLLLDRHYFYSKESFTVCKFFQKLLNHKNFFNKNFLNNFQSEEAFDKWKGFAKQDLLHAISSFTSDSKNLMRRAQDFLEEFVLFLFFYYFFFFFFF